MNQEEIRVLALDIASELSKDEKFHWSGSLFNFVDPFLAAITEKAEPGHYKDQLVDELDTRTAPQQLDESTSSIGVATDKTITPAVCAAPLPEEVREIVEAQGG